MKKLTIYLYALALLTMSACSDFLDKEPVVIASDVNFYKTPEDAYKALVGAYDGLQGVWANGMALPIATEVMSDNTFGGTGNADGFGYQMIDEFDKSRSTADQNIFQANWIAYYAALYRCNVLIGKMDQIEWGTKEELRPIYEAETRFLRAYMYFDMVRLWGNIPLLTAPSRDNIPQADPDAVYAVIAEDLTYAAANLPATTYASQPVSQRGRVTKWAAEALLARAYLYYTGYYGKTELAGITKAQALAYVEDVIANSGHDLVDDFFKLWPAASIEEYAGEDNKETIFAVKYTYTSDYNGNTDGNHWMVMYGMRDQFSFPYGNGWGGATVNPKLWNAYDANDTRRGASIISISAEDIDYEHEAKQREYTGYYNKKYAPMVDEEGNSVAVENGAVNFMIGQFQDYVSIRYADVLLMAAELGSANAQAYFDKVRQRAFKTNFVQVAVSQENILKERQLEFALEGIRYWDLLRQGVPTAAAIIAETTTVKNGGIATTKTITASKIELTKGLQQIPTNQINLSSNVLKQNAGW
ncbi:RagB/SusD family nutrient uptake outer membrane protein [Pseudochryseolinea flava]|uniref:RagB/SusD family nutrient uptake outer membrane protein n=1 Tax=Pseudochryseolinea flava TaxID=2059302 RepID=A0A364XYX3_9BACT|nr:RagB/SusD family nutrient uptake outer membrane protein [Pseudochryseolinea flava]RAV99480.1 RagB/SusD family nutrient uptake outer membrane protein [Pseudochryseolinea flava]